MNKLDLIRKAKAVFMKWRLHRIVQPFEGALANLLYMSRLSRWRSTNEVKGYNDWYQRDWDYERRVKLYEAVSRQEGLESSAISYLEFGVSGGTSLRWWIEHNKNRDSRFHGFDTFEGLPERYGDFEVGAMAAAIETLNITDQRASLHKGLFQQTLLPFLETFPNDKRKLIHMDADIFSATIFTFSQLYRFLKPGDVILFDEFAVPTHEFAAWQIFADSFYLKYEVIAAANNYLFLAIKIK